MRLRFMDNPFSSGAGSIRSVGCSRLLDGAEPRKLRHRVVRSGRYYRLTQLAWRLSMSSDSHL